MSRDTHTALVAVQAQCRECAWTSEARNAVGVAARHHDAHGHTVDVDVTRSITYGDPNAAPPGQLQIGDPA